MRTLTIEVDDELERALATIKACRRETLLGRTDEAVEFLTGEDVIIRAAVISLAEDYETIEIATEAARH